MAREHEFFARCAWGFEQVLAEELRRMGVPQVRPLHGGVAFRGVLEHAYRVCLWSRVATRVQLVLARVPAADADALYRSIFSLPWEEHVRDGATIAVEAHGENPNLRNTAFTALKVKDALCDHMRDVRGTRPDVDAKHPDFEVNVALHQQKATVYLNLSGESLHRRGYREDGVQTEAPLKETLAAGIVLASGWQEAAMAGGVLIDPMCGSGTLAIEAAMIAANRAPGLLRERWGFEGWLGHDTDLWDALVCEAYESQQEPSGGTCVIAGDIDERAVEIASANARRAGIDDVVRFHVGDAAQLGRRIKWLRKRNVCGMLVTNPPYGMRLLSRSDLPDTYAALSAAIETLPVGWDVTILTPDPGIDSSLGRLPFEVLPCNNGPIETWIRRYHASDSRQELLVTSLGGRQFEVPVAEEGSGQFAARLRKVARERMRWARKAHVTCYRVYDADLPEYALAVDVFEQCVLEGASVERLVRVEEHPRSKKVDEQRAARHVADAASIAAAVFDVSPHEVAVVRWPAEKSEDRPVTVREQGLSFKVDLGGTRTGLALEQRGVRELVRTMARGKRVACLFATGGSTVACAAAGGAASTVTVDASRSHLEVVEGLLRENGLANKCHRVVVADVRAWVARERKARHSYDMVLCLPPTWLPGKDAGGSDWDARRDSSRLVFSAAGILAKGGCIVFVSPEPDVRLGVPDLNVEDVSERVVPHDFERSPRVPHCYLIERIP